MKLRCVSIVEVNIIIMLVVPMTIPVRASPVVMVQVLQRQRLKLRAKVQARVLKVVEVEIKHMLFGTKCQASEESKARRS